MYRAFRAIAIYVAEIHSNDIFRHCCNVTLLRASAASADSDSSDKVTVLNPGTLIIVHRCQPATLKSRDEVRGTSLHGKINFWGVWLDRLEGQWPEIF